MLSLLIKEFKLANLVLPALMMLLCLLMLIPAYPMYVGLMYICLAVFFALLGFREANDIYFAMLLPIRKRNIIKGHLMFFCCLELIQLVVAIPVALLRNALVDTPNPVGIEANIALFGSALIMYTVFNLILIPLHYRDAHSLGLPLAIAGLGMFCYIAIAEVLVHKVDFFATNVDVVGQHLGSQLLVLGIGALVFVLGNLLSYHLAASSFEKVDL